MSGLECNVEKTTLLPLGNAVMDNRISELGFQIVDRITILGLEINKTGTAASNFERITTKVRNIIAKWVPFNLSLPGRINIAKSMLYSQINYLGCFLDFPVATVLALETLITGFVKGKLNIAKKRLYKNADQGGLGLFEILFSDITHDKQKF
jgi:hypothetical protein